MPPGDVSAAARPAAETALWDGPGGISTPFHVSDQPLELLSSIAPTFHESERHQGPHDDPHRAHHKSDAERENRSEREDLAVPFQTLDPSPAGHRSIETVLFEKCVLTRSCRQSIHGTPMSVREEVDLVALHRPCACLLPLLHPTCERMDDPSGVARKPVRQDQETRVRAARGEGVTGSREEVVPVVGDHDPLILSRDMKMNRVVLRQGRLGILRRTDVETQSLAELRARVWNVLVEVEPSAVGRLSSALHPPARRVKGISSAMRSGVQ